MAFAAVTGWSVAPGRQWPGGRSGITGAEFWGNADYTLTVDTWKLGLWPEGFLKVWADSGFGRNVFQDAGDSSQYEPIPYENRNRVPRSSDPNYHLSTDIADKSIAWMRKVKAIDADRPFFLGLAQDCRNWAAGPRVDPMDGRGPHARCCRHHHDHGAVVPASACA